MRKQSVVFNISGMSVPEKLVWCGNIRTAMTANAAIYPDPPVSMLNFGADTLALQTAQDLMPSGGKMVTAQRNAALEVVNADLEALKNYVNTVAKNDPVKNARSGFPVSKTPTPKPPTDRVVIRSVKPGSLPGTMDVECVTVKGARYFVEISAADNFGNITTWTSFGEFSRRVFTLSGLLPVTVYWVRVRALGAKGFGAWSDPYRAATAV